MELIDLHTHTFLSDGELSPAELVYRYKVRGCRTVALTDHVDYSNMEFIINSLTAAAGKLEKYYDIEVIPGVELTYIPPEDMENMIARARKLKAELVVVHGETSVEPVPEGTNIAAVKGGCDILAHPGNFTPEQARQAAENDVYIELTTRRGHRNTNKKVFRIARDYNCKLILNTDSHGPKDLLEESKINKVLKNCEMEKNYYKKLKKNSFELKDRIRG
ncbi:MAG: histidinol phosphate phosphatase domain-containing protein [Elusimicrobiota bacterium]